MDKQKSTPRSTPCKCGASKYEGHLARVRDGYPGHAFKGFVWEPVNG